MLNEEWTKVKGLGLFPKEWNVVTAEDVATKISKGTTPPKTEVSTEGTIPFLRVNNLTFKGVLDHNSDFLFVSQQSHEKFLARSKAYPGDILMNIVGPPLGKTALLDNSFEAFNMNQAIVFYRLQSTAINREFFLAFLNSSHAKNWFQSHSKKTSGQQNLTIELCKKIPIPLPNISEQKKIAQILSTWDKTITTTEQLLANSQQQKKALMQQLLTGKKRLLGKNGVRFSGEWRRVELNDVLDYRQPTPFLVKSTDYDDNYPIPVLTAGKTFILGYTDEDYGVFKGPLPVIIFDDFTTGSKFVDFKFKAKSSAMKILIAKNGVDIKYVFEAMQLLDFVVGGHQRHWISIYSRLVIPLPSIAEQRKIATVLASKDVEIDALKKKLEALQKEKKALMQQLLTGKRRVNVDEEVA